MRESIPRVLTIGLLALACASRSASPIAGTARDPEALFFVMNHGKDQRHLEQIIAGVFRAQGLRVSAGGSGQQPAHTTFVVTYEDHWAWDMRTYLLEIEIEVRDVATGAVVGESRSYQDSVSAMGSTYEEIVRRTANDLFTGRSVARSAPVSEDPRVLRSESDPAPARQASATPPVGANGSSPASESRDGILVPIQYDASFGVNFEIGIAIDGGETITLEPGSRIIRSLDRSRHTVAIIDPEAGMFHKPDWSRYELVFDLASLSEPAVVLEAHNRGYKFALSVKILSAEAEIEKHEIALR
jgi:hypothetical protein